MNLPEKVLRQSNCRFRLRVGNARTVLTNIGLAAALWYFLDAVNAWGQVKTFWTSLTGL